MHPRQRSPVAIGLDSGRIWPRTVSQAHGPECARIVSRDHFGRLLLLLIKWAVKIGVDHLITNSRASADALIELISLPPQRGAGRP